MSERNCYECKEDHPPSPQGYDLVPQPGYYASDEMEEASAGTGEWERHEDAEVSRAELRAQIAERDRWIGKMREAVPNVCEVIDEEIKSEETP